MGKIIFIDVDGTLVDYSNNLPESAVTDDVDKDGLYKAFEYLGLIDERCI